MHFLRRAGLPVALLLSTRLAAPASAQTVRFDGGLWFDGERFVPRTLFASNGVLASGSEKAAPDSIVDLTGLWIVPPLADAHTHALADSPDPAVDIARFVRAGILYAKNPNSTWGGMVRGRQAVADAKPAALRVMYSGSGFTSPGGHPAQIYEPHQRPGHGAPAAGAVPSGQTQQGPGANLPEGWVPVGSEEDFAAIWPRILESQPDFVKIYLETSEEHARRANDDAFKGKRGLDPELVPRIVQRAHDDHRSVSAHVRTAADFRLAIASGVDEITHLPLERITPADAKACTDHKVTVVTTVLSHRPTDGIADLDAVHRANLELLRDAGVGIALGTDNMHVDVVDELLAVKALEVFDTPALVRLATTESIRAAVRAAFPAGASPARAAHPAAPAVGTLAEGSEATFLALRRDPLADPSAFREIAHRFVLGALVPEPTVAPVRPSLAEELVTIVMQDDLDTAIAKYHEWRRDRPDDFDFGEPQLNALGYALLRHDHAADAVRIFTLNAEQFPKSPNAWDSLGEAQLAAGDRAAAQTSAQRVLELLPEAKGYPPELRSQLEATARKRIAEE